LKNNILKFNLNDYPPLEGAGGGKTYCHLKNIILKSHSKACPPLEWAGGGQNKLPFEKHYSKISFEGLSPSGKGRGRAKQIAI
jgi:hypothetical protein